MNKFTLITSQFESTTKYFQHFLDSCGFNPAVHWILYTDFEEGRFEYPANVEVRKVTQAQLRNRLQRDFRFNVRFRTAKDFAAFRPLYGAIFADELVGCDYWGYCDCDVIWGDLNNVLSACDGVVDKVFPKGHLSFIKNDERLNDFLKSHKLMQQAIDADKPSLPVVEEEAFPLVAMKEYEGKVNNDIPFVQAHPRLGHFKLIDTYGANKALGIGLGPYDSVPYLATLRKGRLEGWFLMDDGIVKRLDLAYIHFFKREIAPKCSRLNKEKDYLIVPNVIEEYDGHDLSIGEVRRYCRPKFNWPYFKDRLNWVTISKKIRKIIGE